MKGLRSVGLLLIGALVFAIAVAATPINPKKGKVLFRNQCRGCHDGSQAIVKLEPIARTMKQWESAFAPGSKVRNCITRVREKLGTEPTSQDLLDMQAYLVQHAADSDQPASCGN